jgi:apolipoprotein N-acyltransferase
VLGLWGLTLVAFIVFASPAALAGAASRRSSAVRFLAFAGLLLVLHLAYGVLRLAGATNATVEGVTLRIVQPSIEQGEKWQSANEDEIVRRYLELSDATSSPERAGVGSARLVIWPESAFPFLLTERPQILSALAALLPEGTTLITGAARSEPPGGSEPPRVFNSVYIIREDGEIVDAYDKVHLVPFGEYLPFRTFFDALGVRQLVALPGGFSPGPGRRTLSLPDAPAFAPLICYEIVFPGEVLAGGDRPGWLLNLTNDAWYGMTPGPYQHFLQARVRAVEEGLPLVRAANSGISAIVDGYGRVQRSLGLGKTGIVDGDLPSSLGPTPYARYGDLIFLGLLALTGATLLSVRVIFGRARD